MWSISNLTRRHFTLLAILAIVGIGSAVFFASLSNGFLGDDYPQILFNLPVHSLSNIQLFFRGSTFFNGQGLDPLIGSYYRPLMVTYFALLYSIFGSNPFGYHLVQLILAILGSVLLYLFLRYSFRPLMALILAILFLVHPLNSQAVYSVSAVQEPLFFDFGMAALLLLLRFDSLKSLLAVAGFLFLSLLSKETGILFICMAILYLFWFNRTRLRAFTLILVTPLVAYLSLKVHAVGWLSASHSTPIGELTLGQRLMTAPSIMAFYLLGFIFPLKLAQYYHWASTNFSWSGVALPLIIDVTFLALLISVALIVRRRCKRSYYLTFLFFAAWFTSGMAIHLQVVPLDMTASDTWVYFPMVGLLGMLGIIFQELIPLQGNRAKWAVGLVALVVVLLGTRSAIRGHDWKDDVTLAYQDVAVSKQDYSAERVIALNLVKQGHYGEAKIHAERAVSIFPSAISYDALGTADYSLGEYSRAAADYAVAVKYQPHYDIYEHMAILATVYGDPSRNKAFVTSAIQRFPQDPALWMCLSIIEYKQHDADSAKHDIAMAYSYSPNSSIATVREIIMSNQPFKLRLYYGP